MTHIELFPLFLGRMLQSDINVPTTLVVQDIRPDLAQHLGRRISVQIIILDLEIFPQGQEDGEGELVGRFGLDPDHAHGQGYGEVEGVEGGLVDYDQVVSMASANTMFRPVSEREKGRTRSVPGARTYFSKLNFPRSTESSGAVIRSIN